MLKSIAKGEENKVVNHLGFYSQYCWREESENCNGKAASPRCFKGLKDKKNPLGVPYYLSAKAWMNSYTMFDVLTKTN